MLRSVIPPPNSRPQVSFYQKPQTGRPLTETPFYLSLPSPIPRHSSCSVSSHDTEVSRLLCQKRGVSVCVVHVTTHDETILIPASLTHSMLQDGSVASVSRGRRCWFSPLPKWAASFICVPSHWVRCVSVPYLSFTDCHMRTLLTLFSPPPICLPPAALPSSHSLELLTQTGYVASLEKDKNRPLRQATNGKHIPQ